MTELPPPSTAPTSADRLAALRKPAQKRGKPAHTSKIFAAGMSTTAMFALVTAMGWPSGTATTQSVPLDATTTTTPVVPLVPVVTPTTHPLAVPTTVPTTATPVVIPTATPVEQSPVQNASVRTASNTVTKSSG